MSGATFTPVDAGHMAHALRLAERGLWTTDPNPRVGCVLAHGEQVVGSGWHRRAGEPHAEAGALREAGDRARGATAYVTLEPCSHHGRTPPCADALIAAGVARVVYAVADPNPRVNGGGAAKLAAAGIVVESGLGEGPARALNVGFLSRMSRGRPHVRLKLGASLDGRTALADGTSRWITSAEARADVQRLRARSSAVGSGAGTVSSDDPRLDVRLDGIERQPLRVVFDSRLLTSPTARVLAPPGEALLLTRPGHDAARLDALRAAGARVEIVPAATHGLDLDAALRLLARLEVNELLIEAGARFAGACIAAGIVDELIVYLAPSLLGHEARPLAELPTLASLDDRWAFEFRETRRVGPDLRLTLVPVARG